MRPSLKKRLLTSLTLSGAFLLIACGNGDNGAGEPGEDGGDLDETDFGMEHAMEDYSVGDTFVATGEDPLVIDILYRDHPNYPLDEDWDFFQILRDEHNVEFNISSAPLSDFDERRSVMIAAGDAPSVILNSWGDVPGQFWASGAILPVSQYTDFMPHYSDRVENWEFEDELNNSRELDGDYYRISGLSENVRHDYTIMVNKTILDEYGLEEPTSWEELRDVLQVLREETGNVPFSDMWEGNALLNYAAASFDTVGGWGFGGGVVFDEDTDEFVYAPMQQGYRDMVEYFAGLVDDGLMNPESFTQEDETAQNSFNNLNSYVISANSQTVVQQRQDMAEIHGEGEYEIGKILLPEGPAGPYASGDRFDNGIMFSSDIVDRDDFVAILQFFDWLQFSDEGLEFAYWGVEGEHFEKTDEVPGGYRPLDPIEYLGLNPTGTENLQEEYGFRNGVFAYAGPQEIYQSVMDEEEIDFQETMNANREVIPPLPPYPMDAADQEQLSLIGTPLQDTTDQYTLRFITGQYDLDRWDEFMADLENQNVDGYLDIINNAYRDFQETLEEVE